MWLQKPPLGTQLDRSDSLNNPVLDLLMNEGHGDIVHDLSGWGNHGTLHGFDFPPTRTSGWNPGADGIALNFDGTDDIVNIPNSDNLNIADAITIDVTIKANSWASPSVIINKGGSYFGAYSIFWNDNEIIFRLTHADAGVVDVKFAYSATNELIRIIGTWGGLSDNDQRIYKNGILQQTKTNSTATETRQGALRIGGDDNAGRYANIAIARLRILPRAMSAFEVMQTQIDPYGVYQQ